MDRWQIFEGIRPVKFEQERLRWVKLGKEPKSGEIVEKLKSLKARLRVWR